MAVPLIAADPGDAGLPRDAAGTYLRELVRLGPAVLAGTRELERCVLSVEGQPVPVIVNDGSEQDCYLLSPYAHYVKYMLLELGKIKGARARVLGLAVDALGKVSLPLGFNRCVSVNNWLFTTCPELRVTRAGLEQLTQTLLARYPDSPLVIRCVDARDPATRRLYLDAGYRLVVNRPVHEWDPARLRRNHRRDIRRDINLLQKSRFVVRTDATLEPGQEEAVQRLYSGLYVQKHRGFNCRYTARFFRLIHDARVQSFTTVHHEGRLVAFGTCFDDRARTVAALVGYDTALDKHEFPLYRMLIASVFRAGFQRRRLVFLSTGAASFKLNRGSYEWMEYEAVYDRHLPPHRRIPWAAFQTMLDAGTKNLNTSEI